MGLNVGYVSVERVGLQVDSFYVFRYFSYCYYYSLSIIIHPSVLLILCCVILIDYQFSRLFIVCVFGIG